jgi:hypothetical protein
MMKTLFAPMAVLLAAALTSGVSFASEPVHLLFEGGKLRASCTWRQGPQMPEESILEIDWTDGSGLTPVAPANTFQVTIEMPSMPDMTNPPPQVTQMLDPQGKPMTGKYQITQIYFTMEGDWVTNVTLRHVDGSDETRSIPLKIN